VKGGHWLKRNYSAAKHSGKGPRCLGKMVTVTFFPIFKENGEKRNCHHFTNPNIANTHGILSPTTALRASPAMALSYSLNLGSMLAIKRDLTSVCPRIAKFWDRHQLRPRALYNWPRRGGGAKSLGEYGR
jgi:hypothetical protein